MPINPPAALLTASKCDCAGDPPLPGSVLLPPFALPTYPPIFPDTPYFWSMLFAVFTPAATCSPCLSRKLFAVDAAERASAYDTDLGSLLKSDTVFKALCFCAHVVP